MVGKYASETGYVQHTSTYTLYIGYLFILFAPHYSTLQLQYANYRIPVLCYARMTPFNPNCRQDRNRSMQVKGATIPFVRSS